MYLLKNDINRKEHDFHLVNPSPWPIFISMAILIFIIGLVSIFHRRLVFGIFSLIVGTFAISAVLFYWWRDVIKEAMNDKCHTSIVKNGLKIAMYLFILSETIFFIAFFCSFLKSWLDPVFSFDTFSPIRRIKWPPEGVSPPDPWSLPFMNTIILLFSGTTINWAHYSLLENDKKNMIIMLLTTILLGIFFMVIQIIEYYDVKFSLQETGEKLIYASNFYMITGFHCAHVIIGIIFLLVCLLRAIKNQFTVQNHLCFEFASWYWHFIDVIWIFLFIFIYFLSIL